MIFKKKEKEPKPKKEKRVPVMKVGTHKKTVIALWLVLIASVSFGVYKNFTAIIQNPTISSIPTKSSYEPKAQESDGTVDAATTEEVTEFLETFFKLYPTATEKELAYYVSGNVLKPVNCDYVFSELVNPIFIQDGEQIKASISVKYLDQRTKATQISQFDLTLEKDSNWKIVK